MMNKRLGIAGAIGAIVLVALGIGIANADFGSDTQPASAETPTPKPTTQATCTDTAWVTVSFPAATMPKNSSEVATVMACAPTSVYRFDRNPPVLVIQVNDAEPPIGRWGFDPANPMQSVPITVYGKDFAFGETVTVTGTLTNERSDPLPPDISQSATTVVEEPATETPVVTATGPSQPVYAGQYATVTGTVTGLDPELWPTGTPMSISVDGTLVGSTTLAEAASGTVTGTAKSDLTTVGSHVISVLVGTSADPAAQGTGTLTVLPNPPSRASVTASSQVGPVIIGKDGLDSYPMNVTAQVSGLTNEQYPQGAEVAYLIVGGEYFAQQTITAGSGAASVTGSVVLPMDASFQCQAVVLDPTGMTAPLSSEPIDCSTPATGPTRKPVPSPVPTAPSPSPRPTSMNPTPPASPTPSS